MHREPGRKVFGQQLVVGKAQHAAAVDVVELGPPRPGRVGLGHVPVGLTHRAAVSSFMGATVRQRRLGGQRPSVRQEEAVSVPGGTLPVMPDAPNPTAGSGHEHLFAPVTSTGPG